MQVGKAVGMVTLERGADGAGDHRSSVAPEEAYAKAVDKPTFETTLEAGRVRPEGGLHLDGDPGAGTSGSSSAAGKPRRPPSRT